MTELRHDDAAELLGAHALDATSGDEVRALEAHVLDCPDCATELARMRTVAGMIANAGEDASTTVWDAIAAHLDEPPPHHRRRPRMRRRVHHVPLRHALAAGVAALIAIGALSAEIVHLNDQVGSLAPANADAALVAALDNPASHIISLVSAHDSAVIRIVIAPSGKAYVFDPNLPSLAHNRTYELWEIVNKRYISIGVLGASPRVAEFHVAAVSPRTAYALTIETAGGTSTTRHAPFAEGAF